jgi:hypothetical protein
MSSNQSSLVRTELTSLTTDFPIWSREGAGEVVHRALAAALTTASRVYG